MITFFTAAFEKHKIFIPLFIVSCLESHPEATVEIIVDNIQNTPCLKLLREFYGKEKILVYKTTQKYNSKLFGGTIRFTSIPKTKNQYTYITDIDIIIFDKNIQEIHCQYMKELNLFYSNIIRPGSKRLSGLQFLKTKEYYEIITFDKTEKTLKNVRNVLNDENVLYEVLKQNYKLPPINFSKRPVHGIHMSLNREPYAPKGNCNWNIKPKYKEAFLQLQKQKIWSLAFPLFDNNLKQLLNQI